MISPNVNALERIPEETTANLDGPVSSANTLAVPVQVHVADTEQDKYENETDPTVLRKARATAKASHTRVLRVIHEVNNEESPNEELERLRSH